MVHAVTSLFQRRVALGASFLAAIVLVIILNRRSPGAGDSRVAVQFHLSNIAAEAGIDFVHHGPTLDAKLDNIAPLVAALGASVSVTDVNNDGWPDLYFTNSRFGTGNALYHNLGNGRFEDVTDRMGVGSTRWTLAVAAADFNGDGWPDLFLANDYGPEELFVNDHGRRFVLSRVGLESDSKSGMSATLGDVLNRGRLDAFVTNISVRGYLFQGNNLRLNFLPELGRFQQGAEGVITDAGWAWGAQLGDLDNDGRNELFIVNGYVSADRDRSYWYAMSKIAGANGNVFEDARSWPAIGTASLSGYERSRVLVNRGLAGWTDVAAAVGVSDEYDGRAVALVDLFNRGVLDVVIANQNQPALIYKNTVVPANHWIAFKLVGTRSNRSAIGAEVTIEAGGTRQLKVVDGGSGFASQNDRRLHFGLGSAGRVDRAVIRWPSGTLQTLEHPTPDLLHVVTEPGR